MADVILGASSTGTGVTQLTNQILTSYQRTAYFALRAGTIFDQFASVKPGDLTSPGNPVKFLIWSDMSAATTALDEGVDVAARTLSDSLVTVTPAEYGDAIILTLRLRGEDFLIGFDANIANLLAYGQMNTIDKLALTAINAGTNIYYMGYTGDTVIAATTGKITVSGVRRMRANLAGADAIPWDSSSFAGVIHPDVAYDLKSESGDASWVVAASYSDAARIWNDEIGKFANIRFVESSRCTLVADLGAGAVDVYNTYFLGQQSIAKAESIPPHMVLGPVTDKLRRFQPLGWHFMAGWGVFRQASLWQIHSSSTIGANV